LSPGGRLCRAGSLGFVWRKTVGWRGAGLDWQVRPQYRAFAPTGRPVAVRLAMNWKEISWKMAIIYALLTYVPLLVFWVLTVAFADALGGVSHFILIMGMIFAIIGDIKRRSPGYSI
jgi:hypothetical protein